MLSPLSGKLQDREQAFHLHFYINYPGSKRGHTMIVLAYN